MANEKTPNVEEGNGTAQAATEPQGKERTFTQEEVNDLVERRLRKERAKTADYADLKAAAEAHADYDAVVAERDSLKAAKERSELVGSVAASSGVPVALVAMLSGTSEDELASQAAELAKAIKASAYPKVDDGGTGKPPVTADDIRKIKDTRERIRARAAHPELFR